MAFEQTLSAIYTYNQNKSKSADDLIDRELLSQVLQVMFTEIESEISAGGPGGDFLPLAGGTMTGGIDMSDSSIENIVTLTSSNGTSLHLQAGEYESTGNEALKYFGDYSSSYTDRSLVDKEYVDQAIAAAIDALP